MIENKTTKKGVLDGLLTMPIYSDTLPSNNKKFKYRGYSAGEEQALLVTKASNDVNLIIEGTKECIKSCTFGELDVETLSSFDIEYLLIILRARSVGEEIEITMKCKECEKPNPAVINIFDIKKPVVIKNSHIIELSDKVSLIMKYPGFDILESLELKGDNDIFGMIASLIKQIVNGDNIIEVSELNPEEVVFFVKSMASKSIQKITDFINAVPSIQHEFDLKCTHCGADNHYKFKGIRNFFI